MLIILNFLLYLLLIVLIVLLLFLIFPIKYSVYVAYNNALIGNGSFILLKFIKISLSYTSHGLNSFVNFLGFTININSKTDITKNVTAKVSKTKNLNTPKNYQYQKKRDSRFINQLFKKDIIIHILSFLIDLLNILKPTLLRITGKIGFSEPHYTAWLEALLSSLSPLNYSNSLDIKTVWDDEYYQINLIIKGQLSLVKLLTRLLMFIVSKNTLQIWRIFRKEKKKRKIVNYAT